MRAYSATKVRLGEESIIKYTLSGISGSDFRDEQGRTVVTPTEMDLIGIPPKSVHCIVKLLKC
jgi:hypothetical protein